MAKKKLKTWANYVPEKGEENTEKSLTMPDMSNDPRTVLENHVRGINPITGAVLDRQQFYGDAILPYERDLTFEELRIKREALNAKVEAINERLKPVENVTTEPTGSEPTVEGSQSGTTPDPLS